MVQTAVDDQEGLAARLLAIDDPGHVDAALADDVAAELDRRPARREAWGDRIGHQAREVVTDRGEIEWLVALEVRDAEAAADVQVADRCRGVLGELQGQRDRLALRLAEDLGIQVLRAGEDVESEQIQIGDGQGIEQGGHSFCVDAELLRAHHPCASRSP